MAKFERHSTLESREAGRKQRKGATGVGVKNQLLRCAPLIPPLSGSGAETTERNGKPRTVIHYKTTGIVLPGNMKYQTLCGVVFCPGDLLKINLFAKNYEAGEKVYLDNVKLYCLDDL